MDDCLRCRMTSSLLAMSCLTPYRSFIIGRAGEGMYRVARQAQQPLQRSASGSSAGLPPSYPISAAASRSDTEDGGSIIVTPTSILRR